MRPATVRHRRASEPTASRRPYDRVVHRLEWRPLPCGGLAGRAKWGSAREDTRAQHVGRGGASGADRPARVPERDRRRYRLLSLPISTPGPNRPPVLTAAFTSVSAVCVTGLTTVDTATYWSPFGQVVIMALIQVGGFGIMTLATLLGLLVVGKLRLKSSLIAQAETQTLNIGDVRHVIRRVAVTMLAVRGRLRARPHRHGSASATTTTWARRSGTGRSTRSRHSTTRASRSTATTSSGSSTTPGSRSRSVSRSSPAASGSRCSSSCGGDGARPRCGRCTPGSPSTALLLLLVLGICSVPRPRVANAETLGPLSPWGKIVGGVTGGVVPRTAGFNSVDYGDDHARDDGGQLRPHVHRWRLGRYRGRHQGDHLLPAGLSSSGPRSAANADDQHRAPPGSAAARCGRR